MSDGTDLVFITGAPGSKWSAVAFALSCADQIDNSDMAEDRLLAGEEVFHFGNYFGPGMEHGSEFDRLDTLSKDALVKELEAPYAPGADGLKLVKSHMFARHLPYLAAEFPRAKFVLVYRDDDQCLEWWLEAGGFGIGFPDYSWYGEADNMRRQIAEDNAGIRSFVEDKGLQLTARRSFRPLLEALGLTYSHSKLSRIQLPPHFARMLSDPADAGEIERLLHAQARVARTAFWAPPDA